MWERRRPSEVRPVIRPGLRERWTESGAWTGETLQERFDESPSRFGAKRVAVQAGGTRLSLADLDRLSRRVAAGLLDSGLGPGDVVAHQMPNWWQTVVVSWGVLRAGCVLAPITPTLREREVRFILERTGAAEVFVPGEFRGVDHVTLVESTGFSGRVHVVPEDGLPVDNAGPSSDSALPSTDASDPAVVLFTSGTTSDPKGVVHTGETLRCETDSLVEPHGVTPDDCLLLPMPLTHVAGLVYGVLFPALLGIKVVLMDRWDAGEALQIIEQERVTFMIGTPVFLRTMMDRKEFGDADLTSLRLWSMGGAGVAPDHVREATRVLGGCWCKRTYGSTEFPTLTTSYPGDPLEKCAGTDGRLIGGAELRIVDSVTEEDLPRGVAGEILVRGPEMFAGYLDAEDQAAAFDGDGWFRTGDNGVLDEDGYLTIVGRIKDIIIRGGENISAREVEEAVASHPAVSDVAVVRMPDRVMGEKVCAYVELVPGAELSLEGLKGHLEEIGLAKYKWPERLELRDGLPRTESGKVRKPELEREQVGLAGDQT